MAEPSTAITEGEIGQVLGREVGVVWTAADGSAARIMVAGSSGGSDWEVLLDIHANEIVPVGASLAHVVGIVPGQGGRGVVSLAPREGSRGVPDVVFIPSGGRLRLDGPSVMTATDLTVLSWKPDEAHPASVVVEWLPARFPRNVTPTNQILTNDFRVGSTAEIGNNHVEVLAIQGATAAHPAWLVLRLSRKLQ